MNDSTSKPGQGPKGVFVTRGMALFGAGMLIAGAGIASVVALVNDRAQPIEPQAVVATASPLPPATTMPVSQPVRDIQLAARQPAPSAVCHDCGTVESIRAVERKGEGTGVGAVVGGVLGGVVGNQFGGGSGRSAMTVLGAVGGGFAGNEVEKRARAHTVYVVNVRMDDGTRRSLTLAQAPVVRGERVAVEGHNLRRLESQRNG